MNKVASIKGIIKELSCDVFLALFRLRCFPCANGKTGKTSDMTVSWTLAQSHVAKTPDRDGGAVGSLG